MDYFYTLAHFFLLCDFVATLINMKRLLTSCFGLGWLPLCTGTYGSLPPTIIFGLLSYMRAPALLILIVMGALALAGSVVCVKFAPFVITVTGKNDPGEIVVDEIAGQSITFLAISLLAIETFSTRQILGTAGLGFLLFRLFDIFKPWPIRKLEKLPSGWGILADDLLAGVYAAIVLLICIRLWISPPAF
jgi:phosphatidylglycerophosphatase A